MSEFYHGMRVAWANSARAEGLLGFVCPITGKDWVIYENRGLLLGEKPVCLATVSLAPARWMPSRTRASWWVWAGRAEHDAPPDGMEKVLLRCPDLTVAMYFALDHAADMLMRRKSASNSGYDVVAGAMKWFEQFAD